MSREGSDKTSVLITSAKAQANVYVCRLTRAVLAHMDFDEDLVLALHLGICDKL